MTRSWSTFHDNARSIRRPSLNVTERLAVPPQVGKPQRPSHHLEETNDDRHCPFPRRSRRSGGELRLVDLPQVEAGHRAGAGLGRAVRYRAGVLRKDVTSRDIVILSLASVNASTCLGVKATDRQPGAHRRRPLTGLRVLWPDSAPTTKPARSLANRLSTSSPNAAANRPARKVKNT
jgi:hypothetical protein